MPRFGIDVDLYNSFASDTANAETKFRNFQERNSFDQVGKNKKKVRTLLCLLHLFVHLKMWNESKLIIAYSYSHPIMIKGLCEMMSPQFAWNLGEWFILTIRGKHQLRSVYTALVMHRLELFYDLLNYSIVTIKPRDLVSMISAQNGDDKSMEFFETVCNYLQFSGCFSCMRQKLCSLDFIERCIFFGNLRMLSYIWSHFEFIYKIDLVYVDVAKFNFLRPPLGYYQRVVNTSSFASPTDCLKFHPNWIVINPVLAFDIIWILRTNKLCEDLDFEVSEFLLQKKVEKMKLFFL